MFIRNGQAEKNVSRPINNTNTNGNVTNILDISELNSNTNPIPQTEKTTTDGSVYNKSKKRKNTRTPKKSQKSQKSQTQISRFTEYLSGRKYYILALSFIYIIGLLIGAVLVKNLDKKEVFDLCSTVDGYFSGISSIDMTARIFGNIIFNMVFLFGIYICGATVFSAFICSAICLYKGLSCGFIIGVYIIGGSTLFHLGICGINFVLYLFTMIFFILACGESMSFSSFLFRSEDNFKNNLSFKNISVYSSRYLAFLALISLAAVVQTIIPPVVYVILG